MVQLNPWIEINLSWEKTTFSETDEFVNHDSFVKRDLNKPGTLIQLENNKILLIGDINKVSGTCDDCSYLDKDIIKRYKVIYTSEAQNKNQNISNI